jgi:hypothetical protein
MNKAMEVVFDLIKLEFNLFDTSSLPSEFDNKRVIKGEAHESDWLTRCVILDSIEINPENYYVLVEHSSKQYFIAIGGKPPENVVSGLDSIDNNAGLFTALISELEIQVKPDITLQYLEQFIISQNDFDSLYKGHEYLDLAKVFPSMYVYDITLDYAGNAENLNQLVCHYLTSNPNLIALPYSDSTVRIINDLILLNSDIISYESILQSLLSSNFKFAFLDLYRCIEMLYQIVYIDEAYDHLGLSIDKTTFLQVIDTKLNWRPVERNSIKKIISDTPSTDLSFITSEIRKIDPNLKDVSNWIYDLRCNIVHLKKFQVQVSIQKKNWDGIIKGVTQILVFWYGKYQTY